MLHAKWQRTRFGAKTTRTWNVKPIFCNHDLINQDKFYKFGTQVACCILLDISSVFCKNIIFRILAIIFVRFGFFEVFRPFFLHVLRYQFETWYIHAVGGVTRQVRVSFQSGHFDLLYSLKFGTHTQIVSVLTPIDFCHAWPIFGPLVDKNTRKGQFVELPASDTWGLSFIRIRSLPLKCWFIHWVGCTTYWVHVSLEWDPCDLHVLSLGTVN